MHSNAINPDTGKTAEYQELTQCSEGPQWIDAATNEIGCLCRGRGTNSKMPTGTNTMFWIHPKQIPTGRNATYIRIVCVDRPEKVDPKRIRWTIGGDQVNYPGLVSTRAADLTTSKIMINSVLSEPTAGYMTGDFKEFYLGTPMTHYEYIHVPVSAVPPSIMLEYDLDQLNINRHLYAEVRKGMYAPPQVGRIANECLTKFLKPFGYAPVPLTHSLWRDKTRPLIFTLVVDDFCVKYNNLANAQHLMSTLNKLYKVIDDWMDTQYCGLTLAWDYEKRTCDISMPGYIDCALQCFAHPHHSQSAARTRTTARLTTSQCHGVFHRKQHGLTCRKRCLLFIGAKLDDHALQVTITFSATVTLKIQSNRPIVMMPCQPPNNGAINVSHVLNHACGKWYPALQSRGSTHYLTIPQ
jgi:hypothetical protein